MTRSLRWLGSLDFGRITVPMRINGRDLTGVVDTGSTTLGLPEDAVEELGLEPTSYRHVRTAGGSKSLPYIDALEVEILGRSMTTDALVVPRGGMALVGHKQLAELNLLVDARRGEVRVGVGAVTEKFAPTKSLADVVPAVRPKFEALLAQAKAWGMEPEIRSAGRTCEQQNEQLKLGYSNASMCRSMHVMGHAIDLNLKPATCATYTKLGEWWEQQGGVWGGRWVNATFGACGDAGHFHYGLDKAQAVPTSLCPSTVTLAECQALRQKYLEQQFAAGGGSSSGGGAGDTGTSPWTFAAWAAVLGAGWLIFRGTLGVKPGRTLRENPALLRRPGVHTFDVSAGPYQVTVQLTVPDTRNVSEKRDTPSAIVYVDRDVQQEESFVDYEDDLLQAIGRKLGARVHWYEGTWTRGTGRYKTRHVSIDARARSNPFVAPSAGTQGNEGFVYHATNEERLYDILHARRLVTHGPSYGTDQFAWPDGSREKRSYWSENAGSVWCFAPEEGCSVVLRTKKTVQFRRESTGDIYTTKSVPVSQLEVLTDTGWVPAASLRENPAPRRGTGWVSDLLTKRDACKEAMLTHYANDGMVVVEIREGWRISLMPSTRKGVAYQITFWDAGNVPVGHLEFNDLEKAVSELCSHGGRHVSKQEALSLYYR